MADETVTDADGVEIENPTSKDWAEYRVRMTAAKRQAEKEASDAKRELAFLKAGIDLDDPKAAYFVKGYEGELTSEAVKAEAVRIGFLADAPAAAAADPEEAEQRQAALAGQGAILAAQQGAVDAGGAPPTALLEEAYAQGGEDAMLAAAAQLGIHVVTSQ